MRFLAIAAVIASFGGLATGDAVAGDLTGKAGYCKVAATKVAAACAPVSIHDTKPCCCVPANDAAEEHVAVCGTQGAEGLSPCPSRS